MKMSCPWLVLLFTFFSLPSLALAKSDCDGVICIENGELKFQDTFIHNAADIGIVLDSRSQQIGNNQGISDRDFNRDVKKMQQNQRQSPSGGQPANSNGSGANSSGGGGASGGGAGDAGTLTSAAFNDQDAYSNNETPLIDVPDPSSSADGNGSTVPEDLISTVRNISDPQKLNWRPEVKARGQSGGSAAARGVQGNPDSGAIAGASKSGGGGSVNSGSLPADGDKKIEVWQGFHNTSGGSLGGSPLVEPAQGSPAQKQTRELASNQTSKQARKLLKQSWDNLRRPGDRSLSSIDGFAPRDTFIFSSMCVHYQDQSLIAEPNEQVICPPNN